MILKSIELRGFRGFRDRAQIELPRGFAVLTGRNGSGKSTVCDAVEYALTGNLDRFEKETEKRETISDYLWWRGDKRGEPGFVTLVFQDEDGSETRLTRTPDGVTGDATQQLEDAMCGGDYAPRDPLLELCRTSIIRDETIGATSLELPEADRYAFVRSAMGSDIARTVEERAVGLVGGLRRRKERAESEYNVARERVGDLTSQLASVRAKAAQATDLVEARGVLEQLCAPEACDTGQELLVSARKRIGVLRQEIDALVRLAGTARELRQTAVERETWRKELAEAERTLDTLRSKKQKIEELRQKTSAELASLPTTTEHLQDIAQLHWHGGRVGLRDGKCPLCGVERQQSQFQKALDTLGKEIDKKNQKSAELQSQLQSVSEQQREVEQSEATATATVRELRGKEEAFGNALGQCVLEVRSLLPAVTEALETEVFEQGIAVRRESVSQCTEAMGVLESSSALESVAALEEALAAAQKHSDKLEETLRHVESGERRSRSLTGGIRRAIGEVIQERLASLEPLLNDLYRRLQPHTEWETIQYHLRGEVRRLLSLRVGADLNPRFVFSSGQRRAAGLAFLLAVYLSRPWCRLKTLVVDDPVQHIDDYRALHVVELLAALRRSGHQIICSVEDPALADLLCRRLQVNDVAEGALVNLGYVVGDGNRVLGSRAVSPLASALLLSA